MMAIRCHICNKEVPREKNSVVCSDKCSRIRQRLGEIQVKYFPTHGCENCWGDLHQGCTDLCNREFRKAREFGSDLQSIIDLFYKADV